MDIPLDLVRLTVANPPVVSVYADWRVSGRGLHESPTVIEKHLRQALAALPKRGEAHASLAADVDRITTYFSERADRAARAVVCFASSGRGLWYLQEFHVPLTTTVHVGDAALLLPLAELLQDAEATVVAIVDSERLRLIDMASTDVRELEGLDGETWDGTRMSSRAAWSAANRPLAREVILERFADTAAERIATVMRETRRAYLVLTGSEEALPAARTALPRELQDRIIATAPIDIDAPDEEVVGRVWPQVKSASADRRAREVDELLQRLGGTPDLVAGIDQVVAQLDARRVWKLAFDPQAVPANQGEMFLRQTLDQGGDVIIARAHPQLAAVGGVVALLR